MANFKLTTSTKLPKLISNEIQPINTNILIIGGAFSGLATFISLKQHLITKLTDLDAQTKISITLVEPRNGLLNILGIPKCIIDIPFAKTQFIPFKNLNNLKFTNILTDENLDIEYIESNEYLDLNYIQGKITNLNSKSATYKLNNGDKVKNINFDYCVICSGRDRNFPTTLTSNNYDDFIKEMTEVKESIEDVDIISVIGGGAVGIEIAGDIKTQYPNKTVNLIHPHKLFPPEPLSDEFKTMTKKSLTDVNINIINKRIKSDNTKGDLITTDNETISSNLNIFCNHKSNNTSYISNELQKFISPNNNIFINEYLQLSHDGKVIDNVFALGDLVEQPIIKSAGWAMYHGRLVANNISNLIVENKLVEHLPDLSQIPFGMVLVGGNNEIISELAGIVELNHEGYKKEYADYCIGKIKATLGV
ncbi:unnamed protein product [Candida verbasci]|uniref:FAD/NAD(P)-binding domain-containing protein n=1 Tax=Candida verbasci TaxID=1227364 RepID=A0A9W4XHU0_9ASCO|nr:unnamed protein product [Candida verbasci]